MLIRLLILQLVAMLGGYEPSEAPSVERDYDERPSDPYMPPPLLPRGGPPRPPIVRGPWRSVQVNVDAMGQNMIGDAANEPSMAINPLNPNIIVAGWRQFDNVASNFRQAGMGYSTDAGQTWTFPGVLQPGIFRSDPVLDVDSTGKFNYQSLTLNGNDYSLAIFQSANGGMTWGQPLPEFGGDKNWMTIDRTGGIGNDNIYAVWQRFFNCCGDRTFTRSSDDAVTFIEPVNMPGSPTFGVAAVGPAGEVYVAGIEAITSQDYTRFVVSRSTNARDPAQTPTFATVQVPMGTMVINSGVNPGGLSGQAWVAVDRSNAPTRGYVYLLASARPTGVDPLDVRFSRSIDGGATWSIASRVNTDLPAAHAYQWFGAISVAPNGRLDVFWYDTRNDLAAVYSEVYYAYSHNGGTTWSAGIPISPRFNHYVGYPNQYKIGDYTHPISELATVSLIYSATFNNEQDVYFTRVGDCNTNLVHDGLDIANGTSMDCTSNGVPDECDADCNTNRTADLCDILHHVLVDTDADGVPDICDNCPMNPTPEPNDADGDGVGDVCDNCPAIANANQADADNDRIGDVCDSCPNVQRAPVAQVVQSDPSNDDGFGWSTAVDGETAVIGARRDDPPSNAGSAYVFVRNGGAWVQQQRLTAADAAANDAFGTAVAISADTIVIGAPVGDAVAGQNTGAAYVFVRNNGAWSQQAKLIASDFAVNDLFGGAVAISGDTVVVGAASDDDACTNNVNCNSGSAYVFVRSGTTWTQQTKLVASDDLAGDNFGQSVAVLGDLAAIGAHNDDAAGGANAGSVYVFGRTNGIWTQTARLQASDPGANERFGVSLALNGTRMIVGAFNDQSPTIPTPGAAYVLVRSGATWLHEAKLTAADPLPNDYLGNSVALDGNVAICGATGFSNPSTASPGRAFVFENAAGQWRRRGELNTPAGMANDHTGNSVAIRGARALVAATDDDTVQGNNTGTTWSFELNMLDMDDDGVPDVCDNCPAHSNPNQADCNTDGIGDVCALLACQNDWRCRDCEGDGVPDGCQPLLPLHKFIDALLEREVDPAHRCRADFDGDGMVTGCDIQGYVDAAGN